MDPVSYRQHGQLCCLDDLEAATEAETEHETAREMDAVFLFVFFEAADGAYRGLRQARRMVWTSRINADRSRALVGTRLGSNANAS